MIELRLHFNLKRKGQAKLFLVKFTVKLNKEKLDRRSRKEVRCKITANNGNQTATVRYVVENHIAGNLVPHISGVFIA